VRKLYTLRWSLSELVAGRKTLREGSSGSSVVTHLGEALQSGSVVKIDVWGLLQDELGYTKYAEVTNFFQLQYLLRTTIASEKVLQCAPVLGCIDDIDSPE
jgi:hypothetical protein